MLLHIRSSQVYEVVIILDIHKLQISILRHWPKGSQGQTQVLVQKCETSNSVHICRNKFVLNH